MLAEKDSWPEDESITDRAKRLVAFPARESTRTADNDSAVVAARAKIAAAIAAQHAAKLAIGYQAKSDAYEAAFEECFRLLCEIEVIRPATVEEFLQKEEFLANEFRDSSYNMVDFFDMAVDDLVPLAGLDYQPGGSTQGLERAWRRGPVEAAA